MEKHGFISVVAIMLFVPATYGATITVDDDGPADYESIQAAIDAAVSGVDDVNVAPGIYNEAIDFNSKAIRVYSSGGPEVTTIDATAARTYLDEKFDVPGPDLPVGWQIYECSLYLSNWQVVNGVLQQTSNLYCSAGSTMDATYVWYEDGTNWQDYTLEFTMKSMDNDAIGAFFRFQDNDNYYRFFWRAENKLLSLWKCVNGSFTKLQEKVGTAYQAGTPYTIKIGAWGSNLKVYIEGNLELEATDTALESGSVAMYNWANSGSYWDDVKVTGPCHAVQCVSGEGPDTILEGFTITGGDASGTGDNQYGGGMYCKNSDPNVINCIFTGNSAGYYGGGMSNRESSSPTVTNCSFSGNSAGYYGGGMYNYNNSSPIVTNCNFSGNTTSTYDGGGIHNVQSNPTVTNCNFSGNSGHRHGGGMSNWWSSNPTVTNCTFTANTAITDGGGMYNRESSNPMVTDCNFSGNSAGTAGGGMDNYNSSNPTVTNCAFSENDAYSGGGMFARSSSPIVTNCTFSRNSADWNGGGMYNYYYSSPTVTNCTFCDNSASSDSYGGGGMFNNDHSSPTVTNCTFTANTATTDGGGMYNYYYSYPTVTNCILWADTPDEIYNSSSTPVVTYSDVQGDYTGTGNIPDDPLFVNAAAGDLRLSDGSPCLDKGNSSALPADTADLDGDGNTVETIPYDLLGFDREFGVVDIGAFEYQNIRVYNITQGEPYATIQGAIADACDGDQIEVSPGTYNEAINFLGMAIRVYSSGGPEVTAIDANGIAEVYHVVQCVTGEDANTILEGFTITGGDANGTDPNDKYGSGMFNFNSSPTVKNCIFTGNSANYGGGMFNTSYSSPTVTNCTFTGNSATYSGGGMWNKNSSLTVTNCTFSENSAQYGGGMYNVYSSPTVTNCNFSGNSATSYGGGMYNHSSSPTVTNCTFTGNSATSYGGGMYNDYYSYPTVTNCTFSENSAQYGGGMYNHSSSPTVTNCNFTGNTATWDGGGMYNEAGSNPTVTNSTFSGNSGDRHAGGMGNGSSSPTLTNCNFSGNSATYSGGGMRNLHSDPNVTNCIFSGNWAVWGGGMRNYGSCPRLTNCTFSNNAGDIVGGMYNEAGSNPTVTNCILWGDTPNEIVEVDSTANVSYSDVQGGWGDPNDPNNTNVDGDPLFVDAAGGDLRISSSTSPCVDSGDNDSVPPDATDLDGDADTNEPIPFDLHGNPRFYDGDESGPNVVDMGALEFHGGPLRNLTRNSTYVTIQAAINDANNGDEIRADPQIYYETIDFKGKAFRLRSTDPNDPNLIASTIIDGSGHYHVVRCVSGEDANTILEGFTITGGDANGTGPDADGGGMYCEYSSPSLKKCTFIGNSAEYGGGMCSVSSSPTLADCTFSGNRADYGGGLFNDDSSPIVTECNFTGNTASMGAGMHNFLSSSPTVANCVFAGNTAGYYGGGMYNDPDSNSTVAGCVFIGNEAGDYGGGIYNHQSRLNVTNCTFTGNSAFSGAAIYNYQSSPTVTNCILWGDTPNEIINEGGTAAVTYSNVQGGCPGTGNIAVDPRLVDPWNGDFQPRAPECVDAGDNSAVLTDTADLDADGNTSEPIPFDLQGKARLADDPCTVDTGAGTPPIVDMGACERQPDDRFRIITVDDDDPAADFNSVQAALDDADYGDEVELAPGTYNEAIDFKGKVVRLYSSGGPAVTIIDGGGASHVVQCVTGEGPGTILDGFTITGGDADGTGRDADGGGLYCEYSSPTVNNCSFTGNLGSEGGGMYNYSSSPTVTNCTFSGNIVDANGGGMVNYSSSPTVTNCTFIGNRARYEGGGMVNEEQSSPALTNCVFMGNRVAWRGGAMYNDNSSPTVTNCTFSNNTATYGGGIYNDDSSPTVTNCILWADTPDEIYDDGTSSTAVGYSDVQGAWPGTGNISSEPLFALAGDMHLLSESPCLDAGTNRPQAGLPAADLDGTWRILDGDEDGTAMVDMGAYELDPHPVASRIAVWPQAFELIARGGQAPEPELLEIRNIGSGTLYWLIDADCSWLELNRTGGQSSGETDNVVLEPDISSLGPGEYDCTLTLTDPNAINSPRTILVALSVGCVRDVPSATYPTIQSAIDDSSDGDIVLVADGNYYEHDLDFGGRAITVKSENGPQNCIIDCNDNGRGFYFGNYERNDSILDGFTIQNGNALGARGDDCGGGIYITEASPLIQNCDFNSCEGVRSGGAIYVQGSTAIISDCNLRNNDADSGGGMYNHVSRPMVTNCAFTDNTATYDGGGMFSYESSPTLTNCIVTGNIADVNGGGMYNYNYGSSPIVTDCIFRDNSASKDGGGIYNDSSSPTFAYCTFAGNWAGYGGGMYNYISGPTVTNCAFSRNDANSAGGGMYNYYYSNPTVTNCTFSRNDANSAGGGMFSYYSDPTLTNCTFSRNDANSAGGGMFNDDSNPAVTNCILWGNTAPNDPQIDGGATVTYSCIQGNLLLGIGNINEPPLFVNAEANDLRLQVMSPCIDHGKNIAGIYCDIRGSVRPIDVIAYGEPWNNDFDMGACEYSDYYSGTEDGNVPAFRDVEMPSFCLVGEPAEIRWKNHAGFPDDDRRIYLPGEYQVNLVLVSEDRTRQVTLNAEPITVPSTTIAPDIPYSHEYTFGQLHAGRWYLRVELSEDGNQYVESTQTFLIGLRQPTLFEIGGEITPPFDADLTVDPKIEEGREDYFYWSEYAGKLYAIGPIAAVVEWTDTQGDPLPVFVGNVWPDEMQIHVADSPAVELLPGGSAFSFVEVRYAENDAALNGSQFSATSEGRCVLMYGDNANYEFEPEFEVVRTVLWNNPEYFRETDWPIGTEVAEPDHDANCGSGHIYQEISPYDTDIYDRDTRSGQIFAVNLDKLFSGSDDLLIFWYEKGKFGADWPHLPMQYYPRWPSTEEGLEKIVIASCLGSEVYGQNLLDSTHRNMQIYNQPDPALAGWNPNEEHAAFFYSNLGNPYQAVFALRNDLNRTNRYDPNYTSEPYVLLKYQDIYDTWHYRVFKVLLEDPNSNYVLRYDAEAGQLMQPPYPLVNLLPGCDGDSHPDMLGPWWTDYNSKIWARHAGPNEPDMATGTIRWFYPLLADFYYDLDNDGVQDEPAGTCLPWLSYHTDPNEAYDPNEPIAVTYDLYWPSDVPELEVGETLMKPKHGLPDIMNQCSVDIIYGQSTGVKLIDPLSERRVDLPSLSVDLGDLPFHLRTRIYYDSINTDLVFKGYFEDAGVGEPLLLLNVISEREKDELLSYSGGDAAFEEAVETLYDQTQQALEGNQLRLGPGPKALSAGSAHAEGFVTLAFASDDANCSPLPVSVEVIRVTCGPYRGELKVIESDNVFDERLTFRHSGDFGGRPEGRLFHWKYSYSLATPSDPDMNLPEDNWQDYDVDPCDGNAVVDITVGGAGLIALQDMWFSCRYEDELCGWSLWTQPQLHESWIKRVMRQVNLFDQRFKDFHETEINTLVSMIGQIGQRYEGNVALTDDPENMNSLGMLELYETLFRRAAEFSIDAAEPYNDAVANRTLLFASSRIAALYTLLGNEAYGDALDPTIGFTTEGADYGVMAPTIHCFQNQTDSLLSEELALLRGVESDPYPQPLYNRLIWNFTSGDGEVAYSSNYVITDMDADGDIDEYDAQIMYPQGHGDAWGHYLMALKTYYRLLVHPNYTWVPQPEYVLVAGTPVEVDYFDERQFAKIAAAKAKTGTETVDLTYRQEFDEDPENQWQGYKDSDSDRAWGVAGWASRAGQGAYFDWVVANALLPDIDPNENHTGLQKVDRTTVLEIGDIASSFNELQAKLDMADLGLNPVGVAKDAIPFDINPYELVDALGQPSGRTHFEQIYDRALTALNNALTTFNFANQNTQLLRRQQDTLVNFVNNVADREADFRSRLVEIFGYPYDDDIGPAGTYPEDYEGPDIYHFMYVDPSELMTASSPDTIEFEVTFREPDVGPDGALSYEPRDVVFHLSSNGLGLIKPASWTGSRRAPGELQMARSELLQAKANFDRALVDYSNLLEQIEDQAEMLQAQYNLDTTELYVLNRTHNEQESLNKTILASRQIELGLRAFGRISEHIAAALAEALPTAVGFSNDVAAPMRGAIRLEGALINELFTAGADVAAIGELAAQQAKERSQSLSNIELTVARAEFAELQQLKQLEQLVRTEASQRLGLFTLAETMQQASARYLAALARGERLLEDRTRFRKQTAANIQQYRYKDMAFRVFRNDALQKYRAQFDMAAMYAYLAAKAYDYETALLDDYSEAGQHLLNRIVEQRALGTISQGTPIPGGGLAGALAELKQNFDVFKTMMGFNNPQIETTWFSLRKENFRIADYAVSNPDWQKELDTYYVYDLWELPEFRRYCKPFDTEDVALPAFVIPFQTNITNGLNFFGWPGGADPFYAPENFVTKIRSVGVWFSNYDTTIMSPTPRVYLIPVGQDVVRADIGEIRSWQVVEQSIPLPFQIDEYELANNFEWIPINDSLPGPFAEIRRYTRFRAYPDGGFNPDEMTYDNRLIGRSVWNTRWLLIIPGHSLYLSDPWEGMERFISGAAIPGGDGERTGNGVTDIKLFFKTYAYPGY